MNIINNYRIRKCSDINLDLPFFEVLDDHDNILMDISQLEDGKINLLFYEKISSKMISFELLEEIVSKAETMIEEERK